MRLIVLFLLLWIWLFTGCVEQPKAKHIATVRYSMEGCFGTERSVIMVISSGQVTAAALTLKGKDVARVVLHPGQLESLKQFVAELKMLKEGTGCTTVSEYEVEYEGAVIRKKDGSCDWNGFQELKTALFPAVH